MNKLIGNLSMATLACTTLILVSGLSQNVLALTGGCTCPNDTQSAPADSEPLPANENYTNSGPFGDGCAVSEVNDSAGAWTAPDATVRPACSGNHPACGSCTWNWSRSYRKTVTKIGCRNRANNGITHTDETQTFPHVYNCMGHTGADASEFDMDGELEQLIDGL